MPADTKKRAANDLQRLLGLKTTSGCSSAPSSVADRGTAQRTAARLVHAGRSLMAATDEQTMLTQQGRATPPPAQKTYCRS